jgi:hypothetical protein
MIEHGQLPSSPLVIGIVLRALGPGPLTAPGTADCGALLSLGSGHGLSPRSPGARASGASFLTRG